PQNPVGDVHNGRNADQEEQQHGLDGAGTEIFPETLVKIGLKKPKFRSDYEKRYDRGIFLAEKSQNHGKKREKEEYISGWLIFLIIGESR
ncbi:MAG: hypothetical protein MUC41_06210, partial [Syntrophobacteraceae bacterium]|nr:hypothetical protein [Syntrophobacteraceae bacterium]